jgi:hypothetical protein
MSSEPVHKLKNIKQLKNNHYKFKDIVVPVLN